MSEIRMRQICLVAHDLDRIQQQCAGHERSPTPRQRAAVPATIS